LGLGSIFRAKASVADLRATLEHIGQLCGAAGAKGAAKDLQSLADVMKPYERKAVDEFCAMARQGLRNLSKKSKGANGKSSRNEAQVLEHVARLRGAGTDRQAFETAMVNLKADKSVKPPDVAEIARHYALSVTKYKSAAAALIDIEKAFVRNSRFENKVR
jgi:hypothetical protein